MDNNIIGNFISSSIIKPGTEVSVSYIPSNAFGTPSKLSDTFKIARIINEKGNYFFTLLDGDKTIVAKSSQIFEIDGMTAERIIKAFGLAADGTKKPRKRRKKSEILNSSCKQ